ncbi:DeoR family transcriptional regulator [Geodermatophilus sp. SYSU D00815]
MHPEGRQQAIARLVASRGRAGVAALAVEVTTETVRRDLAILEQGGVPRRVHGGAVPVGRWPWWSWVSVSAPAAWPSRRRASPGPPWTCCPAPGAASSSTAALADTLPADRRLLAVTNSVPIAAHLATAPGVTVQVLGGRVRG